MNRVINIALNEVGYLEKKTNSDLNSKTSNAGYNNYSKYGKAQGCNGQAWCDAFVDWCFVQAYGKKNAEKLLGGFSNYTPTSASYFKLRLKRWFTKPQKGDIIFFKNSQRICHTGIVYCVDSNKVYTIEGNTSAGASVVPNGGGVFRKSYALNNSRIAGYGRPDYSLVGQKVVVDSVKKYFPKYTGTSASIVSALNSVNADNSFEYRKKIASANGIKNYKGTSAQNLDMLYLLKKGILIKP